MYEIIAVHSGVALLSILVLLLLHDLGQLAVGFVFEESRARKFLVNRLVGDGETEANAAVFIFGMPVIIVLAALVWPLTVVILSVSAVLLLLRKAVRTSKAALAKHVEDLHKEK